MKTTLLAFLLVWQIALPGFAKQDNARQKPKPDKTKSQQASQPSDEDVVRPKPKDLRP